MKFATVCSGIEAATVAWEPLGWEPVFYSEIEHFPSIVLRHHYGSNVVSQSRKRRSMPRKKKGTWNFGDFTTIRPRTLRRLGIDGSIDVLAAGTPCQSFSIAGLRGGLDDARGNLTLEFVRLARRLRPRWLVWENVPGVLSSNDGKDFGTFLGALAELGYGFAYRILDAQYFGVPQRRRRVFVIAHLGDWRGPAAVLFERASLSGYPAPSRQTGQGNNAESKIGSGGAGSIAGTVSSKWAKGAGGPAGDETYNLTIAGTLDCRHAGGFQSAQSAAANHLVSWPAEVAPTLDADFASKYGQNNQHISQGGGLFVPAEWPAEVAPTLGSSGAGTARTGNERTEAEMIVPGALAFKPAHYTRGKDGAPSDVMPPLLADADKGDNEALVFETRFARNGRGAPSDVCPPLKAQSGASGTGDAAPIVAFTCKDSGQDVGEEVSPTLRALQHSESHQNGGGQVATSGGAVPIPRRLTPRECERLQDFPDDYTLVPIRRISKEQAASPAAAKYSIRATPEGDLWLCSPDGPRYRAIGNSMAACVMNWLGQRIQAVDAILEAEHKNAIITTL